MLEFAIVGAGFSGIAMARALDKGGESDWCVFDKAQEVGGTWRENHYPGAACDVPSHLYSLSNAPNPSWSRLFPRQPEIQAHLRRIAEPLIKSGRVQFGEELSRARWVESEQHWLLEFASGTQRRSRSLILALGGLHVPAAPSIDGLETFAGPAFHSAQWRHDVDLRGKRVAVIGTGASAVQIVPEIAQQATRVNVFQRTPAWIIPRNDFAIRPWLRLAFARWSWLRKSFRGAIFLLLEATSTALTHRRSGFWGRALARWHLRRQVSDPQLRKRLTPNYPIGCKRVLVSSSYYPALQLPQVSLIDQPIAAMTAAGPKLADGRVVPADVLVYGTGFKPLDLLSSLQISGREDRQLAQDWAQRPQAYLGMSPHGYPNLHVLLGPNSALGHNSVLYMVESQVAHIVALHKERRRRAVNSVEATERAQHGYLRRVDAGFAASTWNGGCKSWYLNDEGVNVALWTGTCLSYRRLTRTVQIENYRFV